MTGKKLLLLLSTIAALTFLAAVQTAMGAGLNTGAGPWQWSWPVGQGTTINDLSFISDTTGWAVGQGGVVMKTTDGGANWSAQNSGTTYNLLGVDFIDSNTGWIVGNLGDYTSFVIKTTDGGTTWSFQTLPGSYSSAVLEDVDFINSTRGVAVGNGKVYYTVNGGTNWSQVTNGTDAGQVNANHYLKRVQMVDTSTGYAVGQAGVIYKTTNGGSQWNLQSSGVTDDLKGLYFSDANYGVVVGSTGSAGRVLRTSNGGSSWSANNTGSAPISTPLMDVAVSSDAATMVAGGNNGTIFRYNTASVLQKTADEMANGLAAGARSSGADGIINDIQWSSISVAYAGGEAGMITKSSNTGTSFGLQVGGDAYNLIATDFIDADTGWAAGDDGRIWKTGDGGDSWSADNTGIPSSFHVYDIDFIDAGNGVAVGCDGAGCPSGGTGRAYRYNGANWTSMTVPGGVVAINDIVMTDTNNGWAVGSSGVALRTSDGWTWVSDASGLAANYELNAVDSISAASNAWAVGNNTNPGGKAIVARYSGGTWTVTESYPTISFFVDIDMYDTNTGWLVGSSGSVYKTANGGGSWTPQVSGTSKLLAGVSFSDASYGFAVGEDGRLVHTTDGGANWGAENMGTNVSFFDVSTVGERQAFVAGGNGSVMKSLRSYFYTWYDNVGGDNWVLMANPASASGSLFFDQFIAGVERPLDNGGEVAAGDSLTPQYPGVIGGPVNTSSLTSEKAIVSQRALWPKGGYSIEEVLGMDIDRLSSHYYWTWYDQASPGFTNWVLVANPNPFTVYYQIKVGGVVRNQGTIGAGGRVTPTLPGIWGGPVEVLAWNDGYNGANPADVFASQRVLSNYGAAFNEQIGTPAPELSSSYLWTWYDDIGGSNWILIANPGGAPLHYEIKIAGTVVETTKTGAPGAKPAIPAGANVTPRFGIRGGPVEVKTFSNAAHTTPANSISSQRVLWGPSFAETPGYPASRLSSSYHWSWYDNLSAGMQNWVLVANPSTTDTINYQILIEGVEPAFGGSGTLAPGDRVTPTFPFLRKGPVEVRAWISTGSWSNPGDRRNVMASQRVLYNNFFNEVLGTVLD